MNDLSGRSTGLSEAILARFAARSARKVELDLERLPVLLQRLGQPLDRLAPVVHIAGTNGKGSTLAFLASMLKATGKRVQRFTSPYLKSVTEEVVLVDGEIGDAALAALLLRVEDASDGLAVTAFEALAAAAFLAFSEEEADFLLLETGMGGRMDVTNVVPKPALTMISPIDFDHMALLGNTIVEIAGEKAGILKPRVTCVADPDHPQAVEVVRARAAELDIELRLAGEDFTFDAETAHYQGNTSVVLPRPSLDGLHQWRNAALATAAFEALLPLELPQALDGIRTAVWPARMQRMDVDGQEIWADGGHNRHAATAMVETLATLPAKPLCLVVGVLDTRPLAHFLKPFLRFDPMVIGVPLRSQPVYALGDPMSPQRIVQIASEQGFRASTAESTEAALAMLGEQQPEARILVTGSLYLAGRVGEA